MDDMEVLVFVDVCSYVDGHYTFVTHGLPVPADCVDLRNYVIDYLKKHYYLVDFEKVTIYIPIDSFGMEDF